MAYWIHKEQYLRKYFFSTEFSKILLRYNLSSGALSLESKFFFYSSFLFFDKKHSIAFYSRKCLMHDWSRAIFRMFKMSRHQSKFFASYGLICGLSKASF